MSSPTIDLTGSDDEVSFSRPRFKGKRRVEEHEAMMPSKRTQRSLGGYMPSSTPASANRRPMSFTSPHRTPTGHETSGHETRGQPSASYTSASSDRWSLQTAPASSSPSTCDSDDEIDQEFELEEITQLKWEQASHRRSAKKAPVGYQLVDSARKNGCLLEPGTNIELQCGDFLRISFIFKNSDFDQADEDAYILRGLLLRRNMSMGDQFPKRLNEVVAIISMPTDDLRPHFTAGLQDKSIFEFSCVRDIRFTNAPFDEVSFRHDPVQQAKWVKSTTSGRGRWDKLAVFKQGSLVCRYKSVDRWIQVGGKLKAYSRAYLTLDPQEADCRYRLANAELIRRHFFKYRGRGDGAPTNETAICGDLMDICCGSGGASEGARLSGLNAAVAVDIKECAVRSYSRNHPECAMHLGDMSDFITTPTLPGHIICDICHASCPCQFWSFAHTVAGKNDEANEAAAFMVQEAARRSGCRIMSFEQTPGIARIKKHRPKFNMFINQFTSMGFSVEWKIISFADTGGANKRARLWIWATCPGQQMPKDVQPSHGPPESGLRPYVTVREAISNIPASATMHNPAELARKFRTTGKPALPPAEWDQPLKHLITTKGPHALHPDGQRPFTVRETLCLQGFPHEYHYVGSSDEGEISRTAAMEMAGDAVPPIPSAPYFASAKEALRITDEDVAAHREMLAAQRDQVVRTMAARRYQVVDLLD